MARGLFGRPAFWAAAYLILLPVFATIYSSFGPRNFRDANIGREKALDEDGSRIIDALTADIAARAMPTPWTTLGTTVRLEPSTIQVANLFHAQDGRLLVHVVGGFRQASSGPPHAVGSFGEWVDLDLAFGGIFATQERGKTTVGR